MNYDVAVIGGGASGLACAVRLAESKKLKIAVIDAGERPGKKLAATGNGQGNVSNHNMSAAHYFGGNVPLVEKLTCPPEKQNIEYNMFHCVFESDDRGRVYPGGRQASALVDSLLFDLKRGGVTVLTNSKVVDFDGSFSLKLASGEVLTADYAVMCVGGKAQKQFRTDGSSYILAQKFGHKITPLYPSLVQLKTETAHIKSLKGIRVDCIMTAFQNGNVLARKRGDVIFTDYGVSGNAVFEISPYVADKQNVTLSLRFLPEEDGIIAQNIRLKKQLGYPVSELLSGTLHNQLGRAIIRRCNSDREDVICGMLKDFTLKVTGTLGFDYAQVTRGGVDMSDITDELESKLKKNLFFAGEVLDVDGECGGYNLHWAFASGTAVADAILKRL